MTALWVESNRNNERSMSVREERIPYTKAKWKSSTIMRCETGDFHSSEGGYLASAWIRQRNASLAVRFTKKTL